MSNANSIRWIRVVAIAISSVLFLLGLIWVIAGRSISSQRVRLFQEPISSIKSIRLLPGNDFPLVRHGVVITNAEGINEIMAAFRSAEKFSPNHPATRWSCVLTISSPSGESYVRVSESVGQGTILYGTIFPNGGLIFETLHSKTMGQILEKAVSQSSLTTQTR